MDKCRKHPDYTGVAVPRANCRRCREMYIEGNWDRFTIPALAQKMGLAESTIKGYLRRLGLEHTAPPQVAVEHSRELSKLKEERKRLRKENKVLTQRSETIERELESVLDMKEVVNEYTIRPKEGLDNEAAAVIVASDWHIEEMVHPYQVSDLNEFNAKICRERVERFFRHSVKLYKKEAKATEINTIVLAMLGDFISGTIHEDLAETNRLMPTEAIIEAHEHLSAGIRFLLDKTGVEELTIVCKSGNHGRMTRKQRISGESGNSLEKYMYFSLRQEFINEDRVSFVIGDGYHTYLDVLGYKIRFHHGHAIRYRGGVGGITIPVNKAIANWNRAKDADLDVFGHYHQFFDGGNFICNGSLIGYNAYALSIKASYEPARQAFFLVDKDDGKTIVAPVILEHDK